MSADTMKMPEPIIEPATIIVESIRPRPRTNPGSAGAALVSGFGRSGLMDLFAVPFSHSAPAKPVEAIDNEASDQPKHEAPPGFPRQLAHQIAARKHRRQRHPGNQRCAKRPRTKWVDTAQNHNSRRHEHESEKRS